MQPVVVNTCDEICSMRSLQHLVTRNTTCNTTVDIRKGVRRQDLMQLGSLCWCDAQSGVTGPTGPQIMLCQGASRTLCAQYTILLRFSREPCRMSSPVTWDVCEYLTHHLCQRTFTQFYYFTYFELNFMGFLHQVVLSSVIMQGTANGTPCGLDGHHADS